MLKHLFVIISALTLIFPAYASDKSVPAEAKGFKGTVSAKVVSKSNISMTIKIRGIEKVNETNKAKEPKALRGKTINIREKWNRGKPDRLQMKFISNVKIGERLDLDIAQGFDGTFHIHKLNDEQRDIALNPSKKK